MRNSDLRNLLTTDAQDIADAIASGARWEIWMQINLYLRLKADGLQAAREVSYPQPNNAQRLDVLCRHGTDSYAIELKVESATNAGAAIMSGIAADVTKITGYTGVTARWVVGIGYSATARNSMRAFADVPANDAIYAEQSSLGFLIVTVP